MANIVDLLVGLGIDASEYDSGLDDASGKSSSFIDKISGPLTTAMVGAFATGAAAVGAFAATSVSKFADFQGSMNEVFTLLPGISEDAMSEMQDQVKQFSKDFGVLPEDVVPALYQSLSAGVPADNVFQFLEDANKAATAGVVDLDVAVNGISSVVNAYGADIIDSAKASDLLFTTVKMGKTTFGELSDAIFNVTPSASAAGVKFEEVTASLAAMTLQGVPTSVATTKLRATIDELSKAGTKTDTIFRQVAGKSFKEFLAAGGDLQGALQLLEKHAKDTNVGINDLFGSAEAGSTALLLTGKGTDAFSNALEGMRNSAGATDAAFATMNSGITDAIDDMKAAFAVFTLDVGERLAPFVQMIADGLGTTLPIVFDIVIGFIDKMLSSWNNLSMAFETAGGSISGIFTVFEDGSSAFTGFLETLGVGYDTALMFNNALLAIYNAAKPLFPIIDQIAKLIGDNFQPILLAVGTVIAVVVVGAIYSFIASIIAVAAPIIAVIAVIAALYAAFQSNFLGIRDLVTAVMEAVWSVISVVIDQVVAFWKANGEDIMSFVTTSWNTILSTIQNVISIVKIVVTTILTFIAGFIRDHGAQISQYLTNTWTIIKNVIGAAITLISGIVKAFLQVLRGDWSGAWNTIVEMSRTFVTQIWTAIKAAFDNILIVTRIVWDMIYRAIQDALNNVVNWINLTFQSIISAVRGFVSKASDAAASVGDGIVSGITKAIEAGVSSIINAAKDAAFAALDAAKKALGIGSPSKLAYAEIGVPFGQGMVLGIGSMTRTLVGAGAAAGLALASGATATVPALSGTASSGAAVGAAGAGGSGVGQTYNIEAHYAKYQDERTLRDTIRMEAALNAPALG